MSKRSRERFVTSGSSSATSTPPEIPDDSDDFTGKAADDSIDLAEIVAKYLQEDGYRKVGMRGEVVSNREAQAITVEAAVILTIARRVRRVLEW
jgi:hypothetical protein